MRLSGNKAFSAAGLSGTMIDDQLEMVLDASRQALWRLK